jgi:copper chaperone NosL
MAAGAPGGAVRLGAAALAALAAAVGAGCADPAPRRLVMGGDACTHCHMLTADARYPAQLVTRTGRVLVFDDPGCLAAFLNGGGVPADRVHSHWVTDFLRPDSLLAADRAVFLRSDAFRTPMGHGIAAVAPGPGADSLARATGAERLDWERVRQVVAPPGP